MKQITTILIIAACCLLPGLPAQAQQPSDSLGGWISVPDGHLPDGHALGAISSISGEELEKAFMTNLTSTLFGRVAGLTVSQANGEPGNDYASLRARGTGTFGSGSSLHVVIDGFPSTMDFLNQLSAYEIESIQLLKDAAATAVYGNRAANGVLLVTTKKGIEQPIKIDFDVRYGVQTPIRLPQMLGSYDYATLYNEALANEGKAPLYDDATLQMYRSGTNRMLYPDVDWQSEMLRKMAPVANWHLSARGGNKSVRYFVLFNGVHNTGLFKNPETASEYGKKYQYSRYNFRTNVDIRLSKRLSAALVIGGSVEDKATPGTSESAWNLIDEMRATPANQFPVVVAEGMFGGNSTYSNPLADLTERGYISYNGRTAQTALRLTEDLGFLTKGLSISGAIAFNTWYRSFSNKTRSYARYSLTRDDSGETVYNVFGENTALGVDENSASQWRNVAFWASANYDRTFGGHRISAMARFNWDEYNSSSSTLPYRNMGFSGAVSYNWRERYFAELTAGYYGNDNFPEWARYGIFPAAAIGWVVSNEDFLKGNDILRYLRLRASYGMVGNKDIGGSRFQWNQYYVYTGTYHFGTNNNSFDMYNESTLANREVTWERDYKANVGVDARLWEGVSLSVDWFRNHRTGILTQPYDMVPSWTGFQMPGLNVGIVDNTGVEAVLGWKGKSGDFSWQTDGVFSFARNKIVYNAEAPQRFSYKLSTGHPVGQPFYLEAIGFFRDQADIDSSPKQVFADVVPGDIKYKDQNDDGIIDDDDYKPFGFTSTPEMTLGIHLAAQWKGFDIDMQFQGAFNRTVYLEGRTFQAFQNNGNITTFALGRWTPETAASATYPRLATTGDQNNFRGSTFWMRNGNFFKLRNLQIGYSVGVFRFWINGSNLFSIDHMQGYCDPENLYGYPSVRMWTLGLNVRF